MEIKVIALTTTQQILISQVDEVPAAVPGEPVVASSITLKLIHVDTSLGSPTPVRAGSNRTYRYPGGDKSLSAIIRSLTV